MLSALDAGAIQGFVAAAPFWAQAVIGGKGVEWINVRDELRSEFVPTMSAALGTRADVIASEPDLVRRIGAVVAGHRHGGQRASCRGQGRHREALRRAGSSDHRPPVSLRGTGLGGQAVDPPTGRTGDRLPQELRARAQRRRERRSERFDPVALTAIAATPLRVEKCLRVDAVHVGQVDAARLHVGDLMRHVLGRERLGREAPRLEVIEDLEHLGRHARKQLEDRRLHVRGTLGEGSGGGRHRLRSAAA